MPSYSLDYAFNIVGGKYKGHINRRSHLQETMRYGELKRSIPDITTKMLTQNLRDHEKEGLIARKVYLEVPLKVEYTITEVRQELVPFM